MRGTTIDLVVALHSECARRRSAPKNRRLTPGQAAVRIPPVCVCRQSPMCLHHCSIIPHENPSSCLLLSVLCIMLGTSMRISLGTSIQNQRWHRMPIHTPTDTIRSFPDSPSRLGIAYCPEYTQNAPLISSIH